MERIKEIFEKEGASDWSACFVVATERKIRVLRPEQKRN
jgi:hypothetical protein